jgi:hypothetical protein
MLEQLFEATLREGLGAVDIIEIIPFVIVICGKLSGPTR